MDNDEITYRIRKCGDGYEYCLGQCEICPKEQTYTSNHTLMDNEYLK